MRTTFSNKFTTNNDNIRIVTGDIFHYIKDHISNQTSGSNIIVPHVCNNIGSFGGGFTGAINNHYPIVKDSYELLGKPFLQKNPGYVQFVKCDTNPKTKYSILFANMIAQNGIIGQKNRRPLNYESLVQSMINIKRYIHQNFDADNPVQIHCPKFGCGLAGGNWNFIRDLIKDIWPNYSIIVYEYQR